MQCKVLIVSQYVIVKLLFILVYKSSCKSRSQVDKPITNNRIGTRNLHNLVVCNLNATYTCYYTPRLKNCAFLMTTLIYLHKKTFQPNNWTEKFLFLSKLLFNDTVQSLADLMLLSSSTLSEQGPRPFQHQDVGRFQLPP